MGTGKLAEKGKSGVKRKSGELGERRTERGLVRGEAGEGMAAEGLGRWDFVESV